VIPVTSTGEVEVGRSRSETGLGQKCKIFSEKIVKEKMEWGA
jgi:hypothetical protein